MDQVFWSCIQIDISLDSGHLGAVCVISEASVVPSAEVHERPEDAKLNNRPKSSHEHGLHNHTANWTVPFHIKICELSNTED